MSDLLRPTWVVISPLAHLRLADLSVFRAVFTRPLWDKRAQGEWWSEVGL
jgi:hypothetical protein